MTADARAGVPRVVLLGPQAEKPTLGEVVADLGVEGPVAVVTAGWQEWESDLTGIHSQLGDRVVPLRLYERAEAVWEADPELREAHRSAQADLRRIRELYARQLDRAAEAWMELLDLEAPERLVGPERDGALEAIQRLDRRHIERVLEVRADFDQRLRPTERPAVVHALQEIRSELEGCRAVVIEGGHAAVLYNRIALFDLVDALRSRTVIGCAAGAMILAERVVLYNDAPAIGRGNAEVGLPGFGLVPGVVALPDASRRLRLDDDRRMRRLCLRLAPDRCVLLDPGDRLDRVGERFRADGARLVRTDGRLTEWERAS